MKPVIQTVTEAGKGNCLAACLASILEVSIEDFPDLKAGNDLAAMHSYLATMGVVPIWLHCDGLDSAYVGNSPDYCVVIGKSPRSDKANHAVVGKPRGYGYEIVHDPHPGGGGIDGAITSVIYLGSLLH